jgi:hypothetical protein
LNNNKLNDYLTKYRVKSIFNISEDKNLINYGIRPNKNLLNLTKSNYEKILIKYDLEKIGINQSILIAVMITAYFRMYMNKIMHLEGIKCITQILILLC